MLCDHLEGGVDQDRRVESKRLDAARDLANLRCAPAPRKCRKMNEWVQCLCFALAPFQSTGRSHATASLNHSVSKNVIGPPEIISWILLHVGERPSSPKGCATRSDRGSLKIGRASCRERV